MERIKPGWQMNSKTIIIILICLHILSNHLNANVLWHNMPLFLSFPSYQWLICFRHPGCCCWRACRASCWDVSCWNICWTMHAHWKSPCPCRWGFCFTFWSTALWHQTLRWISLLILVLSLPYQPAFALHRCSGVNISDL